MRYRTLSKHACGNYRIRKTDMFKFTFSGRLKVGKDMIGKKMGSIAGSLVYFRPIKEVKE